ncbi:MAG: hypothetical protein M3R38_31760 [Actinomycetota bacterium]|nr:hypothetical protein [Actinomycetota bacterium]
MGRRRRRKRRERGGAARIMVSIARVILVVLASVAAGYAFYLTLRRAAEGARRGLGG